MVDTQKVVKKIYSKPLTRLESEELWVQYFGNWVWRSIASLAKLNSQYFSAESMASYLNISVAEAIEALEGLERLNLIAYGGDGMIIPGSSNGFLEGKGLSPEEHFKNHLLISTQISSRLRDVKNARFGDYFITTNRETLRRYLHKIEKAVQELIEDSSKIKSEEIFGFTFSCVSLTANERKDIVQ